jgi:hypothetical protein
MYGVKYFKETKRHESPPPLQSATSSVIVDTFVLDFRMCSTLSVPTVQAKCP